MAKYNGVIKAFDKRFSIRVDAFNREDATDKIKKKWLQKLEIESVEPEKVEKDDEVLNFFKNIMK